LESRCFQTIRKQRYAHKCCQSPYSSRTYAHYFLVSPFSTSCSVNTAANARPLILVPTHFHEWVSVIFMSLAAIASNYHDVHTSTTNAVVMILVDITPLREGNTAAEPTGQNRCACCTTSQHHPRDLKRIRNVDGSTFSTTCRSLRDTRCTAYCSSRAVFVAQDTNNPLLAVRIWFELLNWDQVRDGNHA
jgi:hypothetical protein